MTVVIDTPAGISNWYFLSAVSQLTLELQTGRNYYGKTSVYKGIRLNFIPGLPARATKRNKVLALGCLLNSSSDQTGPLFEKGREVLASTLEEMGLELNPA